MVCYHYNFKLLLLCNHSISCSTSHSRNVVLHLIKNYESTKKIQPNTSKLILYLDFSNPSTFNSAYYIITGILIQEVTKLNSTNIICKLQNFKYYLSRKFILLIDLALFAYTTTTVETVLRFHLDPRESILKPPCSFATDILLN